MFIFTVINHVDRQRYWGGWDKNKKRNSIFQKGNLNLFKDTTHLKKGDQLHPKLSKETPCGGAIPPSQLLILKPASIVFLLTLQEQLAGTTGHTWRLKISQHCILAYNARMAS